MKNRELTFRIWDKNTARFYYIHLDELVGVGDRTIDIKKNSVLQQYTGVKDWYGKEIYEGDIVYLNRIGIPELDKKDLFVVEFERGSFVINPKKLWGKDGAIDFPIGKKFVGLDDDDNEIWEPVWPGYRSIWHYNILVVEGNIFENKDLIE